MRKSFHAFAGLVIAALIIGVPQKSYGQGLTWTGAALQQMVEAARWKFGPLRVNAAFTLANAGYDSDVYYGYLDDPVPDFTLSAGAPIQVLFPAGKKVVFDLYDYPQYMFYLDTERERAWNNIFRGHAHIALERFYIQAGGGLSNVRRRLSPELDVNVREKTNSLDGLILWQASRQASLALIYGFADFDYGDPEFGAAGLAEILNRKESLFDLVAYLQPNPRVRFFIDGQYGTYAFKEEAAAGRDARSYGVFGGLEFIPREGELVPAARISGRASLGYLRFDIKDPQAVDGSGLAGAVDLSAEIFRKTVLRGFFSRGFQFSVYSGASFYLSTSYGGGITRLLSRRASLSYALSFGLSDYPEEEGAGGTLPGFSYRYATHSVNLALQLARNLSATLFGTLGKRTEAVSEISRNRNFVGFSLTYGYPPAGAPTAVRGMGR